MKKTTPIWIAVIIALMVGISFMWHKYHTTSQIVSQLQDEIKETHQKMEQKIESIKQNVQAVSQQAQEAGDEFIEETVNVSDVEFLDTLNEYSTVMVERVERGMEKDSKP
jgi:vacuolar-type H+-ATPase subunit E/Vma4